MAINNNINGPVANNGMQVITTSVGSNGVTIAPIFTPQPTPGTGQMLIGNGSDSIVFPISSFYDYKILEAKSSEACGVGLRNPTTATNDNNRIFGYGNSVSNYTYPVCSVPGSSTTSSATNLVAIPFNVYISKSYFNSI